MDLQSIYETCVRQLRSFAEAAGFTDCVLGLSGGLDSSLAALICCDAFGAERVHGYLLPGPYTSEQSTKDALQLAANLGMQAESISITEAYEEFARALAPHMGGAFVGLASENTQARCRMVCLMALSNEYGWMMVNTGNRSEAYMGYSTLYGDTAGAFAPLGCLYKTQVFALARFVNEQALSMGHTAPIPESVIAKPPSAELAADQEDERSLGLCYAELDRILEGHYDQGKSARELAHGEANEAFIEAILQRTERYAFKRAQLPPCPVL